MTISGIGTAAARNGSRTSTAASSPIATIESGSRDDDWNTPGYNAEIAAHWSALQAGWNWQWNAQANWDVAGDIGRILDRMRQAGQVIGTVIAVVG